MVCLLRCCFRGICSSLSVVAFGGEILLRNSKSTHTQLQPECRPVSLRWGACQTRLNTATSCVSQSPTSPTWLPAESHTMSREHTRTLSVSNSSAANNGGRSPLHGARMAAVGVSSQSPRSLLYTSRLLARVSWSKSSLVHVCCGSPAIVPYATHTHLRVRVALDVRLRRDEAVERTEALGRGEVELRHGGEREVVRGGTAGDSARAQLKGAKTKKNRQGGFLG